MTSMKLDENKPANEKLMFEEVRKLCMATAVVVDKIAKKCNINQDLVAKMFIETFKHILEKTEEDTKNG